MAFPVAVTCEASDAARAPRLRGVKQNGGGPTKIDAFGPANVKEIRMDSILVVCYSYTGTSRRAAQLLCSQHGWPLGEVWDEAPRSTLRCILDSLLRRRPAIRYEGPDPDDFRTIILVAPVWVARLAGPMRTFVHRYRNGLSRVAVVITEGSGGASSAVAEIAQIVGRPPIRTVLMLQREIEDGSATSELLAFGDALQTGAAPRWRAPEPVLMVH
jgi:hypothetical protein